MMTGILARLFGRSFTDIFSGYRVFSRRFAKSFPVLSVGFEIETEISVHALELKMPTAEMETAYGARQEGSHSKLSTYGDGLRILRTIATLYRIERPLWFFGGIGAMMAAVAAVAVLLATPLAVTYAQTGLVPRFPTAILVTGLMILAAQPVRGADPRHRRARAARGKAAGLSGAAGTAHLRKCLLGIPPSNQL